MNNEFYLSDENTEVKKLSEKSIQDILSEYPFIEDFINENRLIEIGILKNKEQTLKDFLQSLSFYLQNDDFQITQKTVPVNMSYHH